MCGKSRDGSRKITMTNFSFDKINEYKVNTSDKLQIRVTYRVLRTGMKLSAWMSLHCLQKEKWGNRIILWQAELTGKA